MVYNKNYGFGNFNIKNIKNYFTAIPYDYINSPVNDSSFTNYELNMLLTIFSYYKSNFRINDIIYFFKKIKEMKLILEDEKYIILKKIFDEYN
jgi:hypothetical protein